MFLQQQTCLTIKSFHTVADGNFPRHKHLRLGAQGMQYYTILIHVGGKALITLFSQDNLKTLTVTRYTISAHYYCVHTNKLPGSLKTH